MEGGSRTGVAGDSIISISMGWKGAEELEMLVDTKSKPLINVCIVRLVNQRLGKEFFVLRPDYLIVFETRNASFFFYVEIKRRRTYRGSKIRE